MAGEWLRVPLAEIARIGSGKRPTRVVKEADDACSVPVIGGGGPSGFTDSALFGPGVLITGRVGTLGKLFAPTVPCWPSDNALVVQPADESTEPRYLRYAVQQVIEGAADMNRGAANPLITQGDLGRLCVWHPPLVEQRAIACILGSMDDKIDLNRRRNRTLEAMARAIFQSWFVDFDPVRAKAAGRTPPGLSPALAALFPDRFEDSELGKIPQGWHVRRFNAAFTILDGATFKTEDRLEGGSIIAYGANGPVGFSTRANVSEPCIVLGKIGSCGSLHRSWQPCWVTNNAFIVKPKCGGSLEFVWRKLCETDFTQFIGGSANPYMPLKNFGHALLIVPSGSLESAYQEYAGSLTANIVANDGQSRTLAALRDALLPKLISGELRVQDAERIVGRCT